MRKTPIILVALFIAALPARAVRVADITRIGGQRTNMLTGIGLVTGLKGTGDGGDYLPAIRPLAALLEKFADQAQAKELGDVQNVALVGLMATIPHDGAQAGDKIDVYVTSWGKATSLKGGRLFPIPMQGPLPSKNGGIFAMAAGPVSIEDPSTPTSAVVKGGCVMEADWPMTYVRDSRFTLVIEDPAASWTTATAIAQVINDSEASAKETLAVAIDPKTVVVTLPLNERELPNAFISRVQRLPLPERLLHSEARVQINEKKRSLVISGDAEISPVVICYQGLTISTVTPTPAPTPRNPQVIERNAVALDTTNTGGAKLQDLVNALDQLKVPAEDRIAIVQELYKTGHLHAKLITE